jgi:hypothetical protein
VDCSEKRIGCSAALIYQRRRKLGIKSFNRSSRFVSPPKIVLFKPVAKMSGADYLKAVRAAKAAAKK